MLLEEIINTGRTKAERIAKRTKLKAKRMNPKQSKGHNPREGGTRPYDPAIGMGGEDHGTGLFS